MKVKKVEFSSSEINSATLVKKEAFLDVSASGGYINGTLQVDVVRKYPISMSVVNTSGAAIEIALIANPSEEAEFDENPNNYFFMLPNNASIGVTARIGRVYKVSVRKESGSVSSGVRIDFLNHIGTVKVN